MVKSVNLVLIYLFIFCIRLFFVLQAENDLREFAGREVKLTGRITSEPILQGNSQRFNLGRVRVVVSQYPAWHYGDQIQIIGSLEERVIGSLYSQFSLIYPDIKVLKPDSKFRPWLAIKQAAIRLRKGVEQIYNQYLTEPEASLLSGIVLGVKRGLPQEFSLALQKTGTLHIVVASGYNVTVVIGAIITLLAGLIRRQWAIGLGIVTVVFYTVMAGGEPAIVRAAIMGSLAYFGQILGRQTEGIRLLILAALVMLLINPYFIFDIGFQLSFLATLGLLLFADRFPKAIGETTAAQIMVWPIILVNFGQLSLFTILVNSLILWLVPYIMGLGAILALLSWIKPLGILLGWVTYLPLHLMVVIINWFGSKSWINWQIEGVTWHLSLVYYLFIALIVFKMKYVQLKKTK